ncbi:MAG: carbon-nitrogen hydrolase family protein [Lentisphaerae bacterium]|nr:carbon-nitrogen hydrolase family protein [Lentisphaerota bacterium]
MGHHTPDLFEPGLLRVRVGLCQVHTQAWDVAGNLARTLTAIDAAARAGAELAITPECVLHGYADQRSASDRAQLRTIAEPLDGAALQRIRSQARMCGLHVLLGFAERGDCGAVHNSAALIGPDGDIKLLYRKVHCRAFESVTGDGGFTPGDRFEVASIAAGGATCRVGAMICFDREIPESVRCLRALGSQLVMCPLATETWDLSTWQAYTENEAVTRCRAAENEVFIAVVNHAGRFNGGSFVVGPGGEILVQLGREAEVRVVDVPVGVVPERFHSRPLGWMGWGYRRPDVYARYL